MFYILWNCLVSYCRILKEVLGMKMYICFCLEEQHPYHILGMSINLVNGIADFSITK